MSTGKNKAERRGMIFLERLLARGRDFVPLHCEGGHARDNPVVVWLVEQGYLHIPLSRGTPPKWSREFGRFFRNGITGHAPRHRAYITDAGRRAYQEFPKPPPTYGSGTSRHRFETVFDCRFPENADLLQ